MYKFEIIFCLKMVGEISFFFSCSLIASKNRYQFLRKFRLIPPTFHQPSAKPKCLYKMLTLSYNIFCACIFFYQILFSGFILLERFLLFFSFMFLCVLFLLIYSRSGRTFFYHIPLFFREHENTEPRTPLKSHTTFQQRFR